MKNIIIIALMLSIQVAFAQSNQKKSGIIKYDFSTYIGTPIKTGWLFNDSTYRKLYISYKAADTTIAYFQKQAERMDKIISEFQYLKKEYDLKAEKDHELIINQQKTIGEFNGLLTTAQRDNELILKQFWRFGSVKLHKGTMISVGITAGLIGYMAGKAF